MVYWALLGLVIGVAAAQCKKWHLLAGAVGGALLGPIALVLVGGTLVGCVPDPPRLEDAVAPPAATEVPVARGQGDAAGRARGDQRIAQLEQQLSEREDELAAAQAEVERWKDGLAKCVAKLNEVATDASALAAAQFAPSPAAPNRRRGTARVHTLGAPVVSIVDDSALVSVRLWNSGDGDASGQVDLELVCGGRVVDSATEYVEITARTDQTINANLRTIGADGTCSGRARLRF